MRAPEVLPPDSPTVAVVVATHGRSILLPRLLRSLASQRGAPPYEVVVVDDGSRDDTWVTLQRLASGAPVPVRVLRLPRNRGPASARNAGWRSTVAPLVAFTDDDCVPTPDWLAGMVRGLQTADLAQGCTLPDPAQLARSGPFSRTLRIEHEDGFYQTCNLGYRRESLARAGGFDEEFRHPAGEDTELAWRVLAAGARSVFVPDALVHHDVRPSSVLAALRDTRRWGSVVLAVRKHPPLRDRLHSRRFWRASHPPALLAVGGLCILALTRGSPRVPLGAALLAPYARFRLAAEPLPTAGRRRRVALLPAALLVDAAEVAVCAATSVRQRCLLL
jgi:GT2 family glycosyltransferase